MLLECMSVGEDDEGEVVVMVVNVGMDEKRGFVKNGNTFSLFCFFILMFEGGSKILN